MMHAGSDGRSVTAHGLCPLVFYLLRQLLEVVLYPRFSAGLGCALVSRENRLDRRNGRSAPVVPIQITELHRFGQVLG